MTRRLEIGHLCAAWSRNSPPRLGGMPRAINSSLESERRGGRSTSRSDLIDAREANRIKKEGFASIYKAASQHRSTTPAAPAKEALRHFIDGAATPPNLGGELRRTFRVHDCSHNVAHNIGKNGQSPVAAFRPRSNAG